MKFTSHRFTFILMSYFIEFLKYDGLISRDQKYQENLHRTFLMYSSHLLRSIPMCFLIAPRAFTVYISQGFESSEKELPQIAKQFYDRIMLECLHVHFKPNDHRPSLQAVYTHATLFKMYCTNNYQRTHTSWRP